MDTLRTPKTEKLYLKDKADNMLVDLWYKPPVHEFKYFKIIENDYPHDRVAKVHHMLVPMRPVDSWEKLKWYEKRESGEIFDYISDHYDAIAMNLPSVNSITNIVHWHLYVYK